MRRFQGPIEYRKMPHNYSYGNLAIESQWDNVEEVMFPEEKPPEPKRKKLFKKPLIKRAREPLVRREAEVKPGRSVFAGHEALLKFYACIAIVAVVFANLACVVVNHVIMNAQTRLVGLQHEEMRMLAANNELRIKVEELKAPERIRDIAINDLNMVVARDNIYVQKCAEVTTVGDVYYK